MLELVIVVIAVLAFIFGLACLLKRLEENDNSLAYENARLMRTCNELQRTIKLQQAALLARGEAIDSLERSYEMQSGNVTHLRNIAEIMRRQASVRSAQLAIVRKDRNDAIDQVRSLAKENQQLQLLIQFHRMR